MRALMIIVGDCNQDAVEDATVSIQPEVGEIRYGDSMAWLPLALISGVLHQPPYVLACATGGGAIRKSR